MIARGGDRAHLAHAAMISLHALCCGLPVVALALAAASGAATGVSLFLAASQNLHAVLHQHEIWILALSATLVSLGGWFEWRAWRSGARRGISPLFAVSLGCFALNIAIIAVHRLG